MEIKEPEFNEVEYALVIRTKSKLSIPLSTFNKITQKIEEGFSEGDFIVTARRLDKGEYEDSD